MRLLRYYLDGRRFEWVITVSMLWLAIAMAVSPKILHESAFQWVTLVMSPFTIDATLFAIGWLRLVGLLLNGHTIAGYRAGPLIRAGCAVACAVMWVQFAVALIELSLAQGFMAPEAPFWTILVLGELDVAYGAVRADGRTG